jgi:uncharacterized SAM-binding protein YcdF (DUF218 family)
VLKALLLPPGGSLLFMVFGAWTLRRKYPRAGRTLAGLGLGSLTLCATPLFATFLALPLEQIPPLDLQGARPKADAVVVLGGGIYAMAPEFGGVDTVHPRTLERLRYAALLKRRFGLPLVVTGGAFNPDETPEAMLMARALEDSLGVVPDFLETQSRNTAENARNTRKLIDARRILLVTHALHMQRAVRAFEAAGFEVTPAPMGYRAVFDAEDLSFFDFLPSAEALILSRNALHEYLGLGWYRLRYGA